MDVVIGSDRLISVKRLPPTSTPAIGKKLALHTHSAIMSSLLTQILADVPFDMQHRPASKVFSHEEDMRALKTSFTKKLKQFCITARGDMPEASDFDGYIAPIRESGVGREFHRYICTRDLQV